jgi:hypothetical protein
MTRTLPEIWPNLAVDERLSIFLGYQDSDVRRLLASARSAESAARLQGYLTALTVIRHFVAEGHPIPGPGELG